ncbi:hypothetical protein AWB78_08343 [Caballeronia calidae]|uniref:TIGR04255 family protein n=1 Tax=Caballeronia calidae TaxID=1777139 RepID=A0A158EKQ6_9BURK|nr:TIGR04255 family protein [Caballeronia calidae]SAL06966.1 hypothetical protein AWB78_08343 [Caballeronia calidae]
MTSEWQSAGLVGYKSDNLDRYKRNFLRQAVCEFRFPTLLDLGRPKPPDSFAKALRKEYPFLDLVQEMQFGIGGEPGGSVNKHVFRSEKRKWTVSIKENALSVETSAYTEYRELRSRTLSALAAAYKVIDTDFFTRVGLRYINVVQTDDEQDPIRHGWINDQLVAPLRSGLFSGVSEFSGRLALASEDGGCLLQHSLRFKPRETMEENPEVVPGFTIDIDAFRNGVKYDEAGDVLDGMHTQAFNVFDWTLGEPAREYLAK